MGEGLQVATVGEQPEDLLAGVVEWPSAYVIPAQVRSDSSAWGDSPYIEAEDLSSDDRLDALRNYVHAGGNLLVLAGGGDGDLGLSVVAAVLDAPIGCERAEALPGLTLGQSTTSPHVPYLPGLESIELDQEAADSQALLACDNMAGAAPWFEGWDDAAGRPLTAALVWTYGAGRVTWLGAGLDSESSAAAWLPVIKSAVSATPIPVADPVRPKASPSPSPSPGEGVADGPIAMYGGGYGYGGYGGYYGSTPSPSMSYPSPAPSYGPYGAYPSPAPTYSPVVSYPPPAVTESPSPEPEPEPKPAASPAPEPQPTPTPEDEPSPSPEREPTPSPEDEPSPSPEPKPSPSPEVEPSPAPKPEPEPKPSPSPEVEPSPAPKPKPSPSPEVEPSPAPKPEPSPEPKPSPRPEPSPDPSPSPSPSPPLPVKSSPPPVEPRGRKGLGAQPAGCYKTTGVPIPEGNAGTPKAFDPLACAALAHGNGDFVYVGFAEGYKCYGYKKQSLPNDNTKSSACSACQNNKYETDMCGGSGAMSMYSLQELFPAYPPPSDYTPPPQEQS
ncbi:hypothetical protein HXX76_003124 [Chlamydomonas incerta]|uniref:Uncharacterized protein n=1 Tax=Chlamydomonas incerta TaxID=51695 RepID=A0A835T9P8_CHLIN|nr:hypothetical protein HXX76_003124 [Chlamydomonas incerta]|eukprot:KAG2441502.1 hypothetical protein HXX76_003124 [Chlamydomonas incerta]